MARFNFKDNPGLNDETFIGNQKFRWNGTAWAREQFDLNALLSQLQAETITAATNNVLGTAPEALDTIEEIAAALNNDPNFYTTIGGLITANSTTLATKSDLTKTVNSLTGSAHTLALADAGKIIHCSTNNIVITIPTNVLVAFPIGTEIGLVRAGSQTVQIVGLAGVTVQSIDNKNKIKGQYGTAAILKVAENTWVLAGSLEA